MRRAALLLLALAAGAAADSDLRLALYADTMLAVGEWAQVPEQPSRTMFGPDIGAELELTLRLDGVLWGLTAKYGRYDTSGYVGTGEEPNRVEEAEAGSLALMATAGLLLDDWGAARPWVGLGLGAEWLRATETVGGRQYNYGRIFLPAPCVGLTFGLFFISPRSFSCR